MQPKDLQQPGIRGVAVTVGVAGLRSGVSADTYVHDPDEFREGLGRRIPPADGHLDSLLDRAAFKRAAAVARQGTHADGLSPSTLFFNVLKSLHPPSVRSWENTWKYPSCVIDRFVSSRTVKVESVVRSSLERTPRSDACKKEKETYDLCALTCSQHSEENEGSGTMIPSFLRNAEIGGSGFLGLPRCVAVRKGDTKLKW